MLGAGEVAPLDVGAVAGEGQRLGAGEVVPAPLEPGAGVAVVHAAVDEDVDAAELVDHGGEAREPGDHSRTLDPVSPAGTQ